VDQLKRLVEMASRRNVVTIGNVDATIFERATKEEMEAEVRRCIDTAARFSRYVLSTSCEIPPRSKPEIVKWFMDAAYDYGRYERILG
jgi:uroporphyrinogen-III decarboxylase